MKVGRLEPGDLERWLTLLRSAFNVKLEDAARWMEQDGHDNVRLIRDARGVLGGHTLLPMGQFYGGRRVPMAGIGAVAVAPEFRGGGTAIRLMEEAVREMYATGFPLSVLYPATQVLYRKSGYEQAGLRCHASMKLSQIGLSDRSLPLVALPSEPARVEELYGRWARMTNGAVDRTFCNWIRVLRRHEDPIDFYGVGEPLEGYLALRRTGGIANYNLELTDLIATSADAARRLFSLLADHRTLADEVLFPCLPQDPILAALPEQYLQLRLRNWWMLRVVDVPRALAERGYPRTVRTSLDLEVHDELIPDNRGPWRVEIRDGQAQVETGGKGRLKVGIRGLACLYGGFFTPWQARAAGLLDGPDEELARLEGVFGSPAAMVDGF
ncbi:MAG: GNAT family N-acetyltransferase [Candidatus Eremiobacterota bacterium]